MPSPTAATTTLVHTPGSITPHHSVIPTTLGSPVGGAVVSTCGTGGVSTTQQVGNAVSAIPGSPAAAAAPGKPSLPLHR